MFLPLWFPGQEKRTIAGYFTMRSRFVDFTGQYVLHCHILAHEDRAMMELVEVTKQPKRPVYAPLKSDSTKKHPLRLLC